MTTDTPHYWHIAYADESGIPRLAFHDQTEIKAGETLTIKGEIKPCYYGYHMCPRLIDCLRYAKGTVICKVLPGNRIIRDRDKIVSNARTVIAMTTAAEGERILREFARWCALQVIDLWDAPDVVRQYMETGDESIKDVAWDAAWAVSWSAAETASLAAARASAWDAAWDSAETAAMNSVLLAAETAARSAAEAAARAVAWDTAQATGQAVSWAAAGTAAWNKQNAHLTELVEAQMATPERSRP